MSSIPSSVSSSSSSPFGPAPISIIKCNTLRMQPNDLPGVKGALSYSYPPNITGAITPIAETFNSILYTESQGFFNQFIQFFDKHTFTSTIPAAILSTGLDMAYRQHIFSKFQSFLKNNRFTLCTISLKNPQSFQQLLQHTVEKLSSVYDRTPRKRLVTLYDTLDSSTIPIIAVPWIEMYPQHIILQYLKCFRDCLNLGLRVCFVFGSSTQFLSIKSFDSATRKIFTFRPFYAVFDDISLFKVYSSLVQRPKMRFFSSSLLSSVQNHFLLWHTSPKIVQNQLQFAALHYFVYNPFSRFLDSESVPKSLPPRALTWLLSHNSVQTFALANKKSHLFSSVQAQLATILEFFQIIWALYHSGLIQKAFSLILSIDQQLIHKDDEELSNIQDNIFLTSPRKPSNGSQEDSPEETVYHAGGNSTDISILGTQGLESILDQNLSSFPQKSSNSAGLSSALSTKSALSSGNSISFSKSESSTRLIHWTDILLSRQTQVSSSAGWRSFLENATYSPSIGNLIQNFLSDCFHYMDILNTTNNIKNMPKKKKRNLTTPRKKAQKSQSLSTPTTPTALSSPIPIETIENVLHQDSLNNQQRIENQNAPNNSTPFNPFSPEYLCVLINTVNTEKQEKIKSTITKKTSKFNKKKKLLKCQELENEKKKAPHPRFDPHLLDSNLDTLSPNVQKQKSIATILEKVLNKLIHTFSTQTITKKNFKNALEAIVATLFERRPLFELFTFPTEFPTLSHFCDPNIPLEIENSYLNPQRECLSQLFDPIQTVSEFQSTPSLVRSGITREINLVPIFPDVNIVYELLRIVRPNPSINQSQKFTFDWDVLFQLFNDVVSKRKSFFGWTYTEEQAKKAFGDAMLVLQQSGVVCKAMSSKTIRVGVNPLTD